VSPIPTTTPSRIPRCRGGYPTPPSPTARRCLGAGWPKPLAEAVSVAVAAQLVTAPLVAGISGTFSVVSVVANLAVAAGIPPITVVGTAAAALCPLWPSGVQLLIRFTGPEVWWLLRVARWAAGVLGDSVSVPPGLLGVGCVAAAGVAAVLGMAVAVGPRRNGCGGGVPSRMDGVGGCRAAMTRSWGERRGRGPALGVG
jgi:Competence protein